MIRNIKYKKSVFFSLIKGSAVFLDNALAYYALKKPGKGPLFVGWDVNAACNARCHYCRRWVVQKQRIGKELSTEQALSIINELGAFKTKFLAFSGGEPLLRKDIFALIKEAKSMKMHVNLSTNGSLVEKYAGQLISSGVDSVTISVQGHDSQTHDKLMGRKGGFEQLLRGISKMKKLRAEKSHPVIKLRTLVTRENIAELEKMLAFWHGITDEFLLQPVHDSRKIYFINPDNKSNCPANEKAEKAYSKKGLVPYLKKDFVHLLRKYKMNNPFNQEVRDFLFNKETLRGKTRCFASFFFAEIDYDGSLYSCSEHCTKLGDLKQQSFKQLWLSPKASGFRRIIRKNKNTCFCWYTCSLLNTYLSKVLRK